MDIRQITGEYFLNKERIDLFSYTFPCQDISQQGKSNGFKKGSQTRSGLLWEVERILNEIYNLDRNKLPRMLLMENVKSLLNRNFKEDLDSWINALEKLGYKSVTPFVVNAKDLGEPQNRARVFLISFLEKQPREFDFEQARKKMNIRRQKVLRDIIDFNDERKKLVLNDNIEIIRNYSKKDPLFKKGYLKGYTTFDSENYVYYLDGIAPTITAQGAQSRIKFFGDDGEIYFLNPKEYLFLQGWKKSDWEKIKKLGLGDNKIKLLAGNAINIKMLELVLKYYLPELIF